MTQHDHIAPERFGSPRLTARAWRPERFGLILGLALLAACGKDDDKSFDTPYCKEPEFKPKDRDYSFCGCGEQESPWYQFCTEYGEQNIPTCGFAEDGSGNVINSRCVPYCPESDPCPLDPNGNSTEKTYSGFTCLCIIRCSDSTPCPSGYFCAGGQWGCIPLEGS